MPICPRSSEGLAHAESGCGICSCRDWGAAPPAGWWQVGRTPRSLSTERPPWESRICGKGDDSYKIMAWGDADKFRHGLSQGFGAVVKVRLEELSVFATLVDAGSLG